MIILCFFVFSGCQSNEKENIDLFDEQTITGLKEKAKTYSDNDYLEGKVPNNEYIRLTGKIIETDGEERKVVLGDRFVLKTTGNKYHVINNQETELFVGDNVVVYGEYYGLIKCYEVEIN